MPSGIASAARTDRQKQDDFMWVVFRGRRHKDRLKSHIAEALQTMKEAEHILVVFCDAVSGSPFNAIVPESMKDRRIEVGIYGTNLAMLIRDVDGGVTLECLTEILEGIIESRKTG